jgi:hypothetical protein
VSDLSDHLFLQLLASEHLTGEDTLVHYLPGTGYVVCRECMQREGTQLDSRAALHPVRDVPRGFICTRSCRENIWKLYVPTP